MHRAGLLQVGVQPPCLPGASARHRAQLSEIPRPLSVPAGVYGGFSTWDGRNLGANTKCYNNILPVSLSAGSLAPLLQELGPRLVKRTKDSLAPVTQEIIEKPWEL